MTEEEPKKVEFEEPFMPAEEGPTETSQPQTAVPVSNESNEKPPDAGVEKSSGGSVDRDTALAGLEKDKKLALIKAWEDSQKSKAENKAQKHLSSIGTWEGSKKASIEAQLRKFEEKLERKKAAYAEKMNNKVAAVHKEGEEKKASIEAKRGEDFLRIEEQAAKYRAAGMVPKKSGGCCCTS